MQLPGEFSPFIVQYIYYILLSGQGGYPPPPS